MTKHKLFTVFVTRKEFLKLPMNIRRRTLERMAAQELLAKQADKEKEDRPIYK